MNGEVDFRARVFNCIYTDCGATFTREWRVKEHETVHTGARPLQCQGPGCGRSFSRKSHLRRHERSHDGEKRFRCTSGDCSRAFFNADNLKRHIKYAHGDKDHYFKCHFPDCTMTFRKRKAFKMHLNVHSPSPNFKCTKEACTVKVNNPAALRAHAKTHAGYSCPHPGCQVVVYTWGNLCKHSREHPATFTCKQCQKNFTKKAALRRHTRSHAERRPDLLCPNDGCEVRFTTAFNLEHHIRKVHLQLFKYSCYYPDCSRTFVMQESLNCHMLYHDPDGIKMRVQHQRAGRPGQKRRTPPLVEDDLRRLFSLHLRFSHRGKLEVDLSSLFNERKIPRHIDPEVNLRDLFCLKPPGLVVAECEATPATC